MRRLRKKRLREQRLPEDAVAVIAAGEYQGGRGMFQKGQIYENVYMIFVDAAGHSNVVRSNPRNASDQAFDLLYQVVWERLQEAVGKKGCGIAEVWSWLGDGGMFAVHDEKEQVALETALMFARSVLLKDLKRLRREFAKNEINGEIHLRIAVHKGTIRYTEQGRQGLIHSSDINWGAHLEEVTPQDSVAISKDIYGIMGNNKQGFVHAGRFEEREVYVFTPRVDAALVRRNWTMAQGLEGLGMVQGYLQRVSQRDKAALINTARTRVVDFGTTLTTCANYLLSTERPAYYRDAVISLLNRGGSFVCYMLAPDSPGSRQLAELRMEDTDGRLEFSMERFKAFKSKDIAPMEGFQVYQYPLNSNMAAMFIDPESEDGVCLYSSYLNGVPKDEEVLDRADMPHYLVSRRKGGMYEYIWNYVSDYMEIAQRAL